MPHADRPGSTGAAPPYNGGVRSSVLLALVSISLAAGDSQVPRGTVTDSEGHPLADVRVCRPLVECTCSDSRGHFAFPAETARSQGDAELFFARDGFAAVTLRADVERPLKVSLSPSDSSPWLLPVCPPQGDASRRLSALPAGFTLDVPENVRVRHFADADYGCVRVRPRWGRGYLLLCGGPHWSYLPAASPLPEGVRVTARREVRHQVAASCEDIPSPGMDARGIDDAGADWRYVGGLFETIEVYAPSERSQKLFDAILDTLCVPERPDA